MSGFIYFEILDLFGGIIWIFCICGILFISLGFIWRVYLVIKGLFLGMGVIKFDFSLVLIRFFIFLGIIFFVVGVLILFLVVR